ncbi:MAG TPA: response regulator, partial [Tenuifilaceae bacterium]|nr:response regulator [Tenuifilaceae bacterium]
MSIKTVIIDDHPHAIALLSDELKAVCVDIDVVGTANSPKEGYQLIKNSNPHLVFLDIDMPEMDGFSLLAHFPNPSFKVIFVTAFDNFAIKAFKADALDYLLKPVDRDELVRAINKYRKLTIIEQSPSTDHNLSEVCRLAVPFNGSIVFLDMLD